MASAEATALYLPDRFAVGPLEAFIDGHEFCHLNPDAAIHLTLPLLVRNEVVRLGWGEEHPITKLGILPALLTVYAPRERSEIIPIWKLVVLSCRFAMGELTMLNHKPA